MLALAMLLGVCAVARADAPAAERGTIAVRPESGRRAPVELAVAAEGGFSGAFTIENVGHGELAISRVVVRTSASDPRTPAGLSVDVEGGAAKLTLAPGEKRRAVVRWRPGPQVKAREVYGHVLVESTSLTPGDAAPGRPVAVGIHAERPSSLGFVGAHALSILTFLPLLGLLVVFLARLARYDDDRPLRHLVTALMAVNLALAVWVYAHFDPSFSRVDGNDGYQLVEHGVWIRSLAVEYFVGVDGVSISMIVLTALLAFVGALASYAIQEQPKGYLAMYCLLVTGVMGVFVAQDLVLFFVFSGLVLLPMHFLLGVWGGPRRQYAAIKLFLYSIVGSALLLLAFVWLHLSSDPTYLVDGHAAAHSFSIPELSRVAFADKGLTIFGVNAVEVVWSALFLGFAVRIPMVPLHTWLPDAEAEAPTAVNILSAVLLPIGTYGLLRVACPILPEATQWAAPMMATFGVVGILYGALCAMAERDLKRFVAYSSISQMGFCLLALGSMTPQGIEACLVQMFSYGLITALLYAVVGVLSDRVHTRDLDRFGGLAGEMPLYTAFAGFAFMASLGLPGLSGFWGQAMTLLGAFPRYRALTMLAAAGVVLIAACHLSALQRVFFGRFRDEWRQSKYLEPFGGRFPELRRLEIATLAPLAALVLLLGFWPRPLLGVMDRASLEVHRLLDRAGATEIAAPAAPDTDRAFARR
jgi:NADH-quinone oxidoreductase subunit M